MAVPADHPYRPAANQPVIFQPGPLRVAISALGNGAAYALAARLFTVINPLGGFCFGMAYSLSTSAIHWIFKYANIQVDTPVAKIAKWALIFFGGNAIGALAATAIGFPIKFGSAIVFSLITNGMIVMGALCIVAVVVTVAAVVTAIVISVRMRRDRCTAAEAARTLIQDLVLLRHMGNVQVELQQRGNAPRQVPQVCNG